MRDLGCKLYKLINQLALIVALGTLFLISGCCCIFRCGIPDTERVMLTMPMIKKYQVTYQNLTKLQLYLSNPLTLERFAAHYDNKDREVTENSEDDKYEDDHILNKIERTRMERLIFDDDLPGKMIVLLPERKKNPDLPMVKSRLVNLNWLPAEMHVNFDNVYLNYLTFVLNDQGEFALAYNREKNTLDYGGSTFKIVAGAELCKLMVDVTNDSSGVEQEYILPGNEFR